MTRIWGTHNDQNLRNAQWPESVSTFTDCSLLHLTAAESSHHQSTCTVTWLKYIVMMRDLSCSQFIWKVLFTTNACAPLHIWKVLFTINACAPLHIWKVLFTTNACAPLHIWKVLFTTNQSFASSLYFNLWGEHGITIQASVFSFLSFFFLTKYKLTFWLTEVLVWVISCAC